LTDLLGAESKLLNHSRNDARARRLTDALAGSTNGATENEPKLRFTANHRCKNLMKQCVFTQPGSKTVFYGPVQHRLVEVAFG
jgi:hypothetical protein